MKKKIPLRLRIFSSVILTACGIIIIFWFICRGYYFEGFINPRTTVDLVVASEVGDFIGGFVGVIFTLVGILLLYETLAFQRKELEESRKVFERQQFENTFFSLLNLYQEIVKTLHIENENSSVRFTDKEFFKQEKNILYEKFTPNVSIYKNRKIVHDLYFTYYLEFKENIAHYFRTLYRIFKIIDESMLINDEKEYYAKIVRAQLSESELFFINYNACHDIGEKFRPYIVKYNLLKHLPIFERLEFKEWASILDPIKQSCVDAVFEEIEDYLENPTPKGFYKTYLKGYFAFRISKNDISIEITIYRTINVTFQDYIQDGYGLADFDNSKIESLLKCFLVNLLYFRSYNTKNVANSILIKTHIENDPENENKSFIYAEAISKTNNKINI